MLEWSNIWSAAVNVLYLILILGTVIVIVLDNRNPVKTIAWILVLTFLPVVGLLFYFFFGQNVRKERLISKRSYWQIARKPLRGYWRKPPGNLPKEYLTLVNLFRRMNRSMPFGGNRVEVYADGQSLLQEMLRAIYQAQHHIHLEFYIFEDDAVGRLVSDALVDRARAGVRVRVLYDDVGCWRVPDCFFRRLRAGGVEVFPFLKVYFPIFSNRMNYRNHRKILVVDGRVGFVGGMNLAERYMRGLSWGIWRDTACMIHGAAVQGLQTVFLMDWCFVTREMIGDAAYFPKQDAQGDTPIQIVSSKPVGRWRDIMQGFLWAIGNARHYIYIQTPYFLPTEQILTALQTAALSGVDVRIMLPWRADSRIVQMCSRSFLRDVMEASVKVYFYHRGFLHSKLLVMDDFLSSIGSTNWDFRSLEHNFEVNAFMYEAETAKQLRKMFESDQQHCTHLSSQRWARRSFWRKVEESVLRILAPLL